MFKVSDDHHMFLGFLSPGGTSAKVQHPGKNGHSTALHVTHSPRTQIRNCHQGELAAGAAEEHLQLASWYRTPTGCVSRMAETSSLEKDWVFAH